MSIWTHIAACIRIDDLILSGLSNKYQKIYDIIKFNLPHGSEGPLKFKVRRNPDEACLAAYVITIWGDLRDFDNSDKIIKFFKKIFDCGCVIREAIVSIRVEGKEKIILTIDNDDGVKMLKFSGRYYGILDKEDD